MRHNSDLSIRHLTFLSLESVFWLTISFYSCFRKIWDSKLVVFGLGIMLTDTVATFEEALYDKLILFEHILVTAVDYGDGKAMVADAGNKVVIAAVDTRDACDDMMCGLKQKLLLENCHYYSSKLLEGPLNNSTCI